MKRLFSNAFNTDVIEITKRYSPDIFQFSCSEGMGMVNVKLPQMKTMDVKIISNPKREDECVFVDGGNRVGIGIGKFIGVLNESISRTSDYFEVEDITPLTNWLGVSDTITYEEAKNRIENFTGR